MIARMAARATYSKLQRWTDLIAALLARRMGATFLELAHDVPAYAKGLVEESKDSVKRTFERDKDELREFGLPIETIPAEESEDTRYRLRSNDFYLPFLALADSETTRAIPAEGYRSLGSVTLTPDDLALLGEAVARLEQLGDPTLAEDVRAAANKLAFDLPLFGPIASDVRLLDANRDADGKIFELLADALRKRKVVSFKYQKPSTRSVTERHVEPYGLFFVNAHWYLAAHDRTRDATRNFRLSRMKGLVVSKKRPQTPDFEIPRDFRLREHAKARDSWELGDVEALVAEVDFSGRSGAAVAGARAGEEMTGRRGRRRFTVRRLDAFARWLLSFGGEARPVAPPELVELYRRNLRETLAVYGEGPRT